MIQRILQPQQCEWIPSDSIILEPKANYAVKIQSNVLVVAGPGAGKTELLAQKSGYLFQTNNCKNPQKILAISFKKDAAENLKQRVMDRYGYDYSMRFVSMTYDAFAKTLLVQFLYALPEDLRPNQNFIVNDRDTIGDAFINEGDILHLSLSHSKLQKYYDDIIESTVLPLQEGMGAHVWKKLLKGFNGNPSSLTFKMISKLSEFIVRTNPCICKALQCTYSHVFLDEFQDTTNLQYVLVKTCFKDSSTFMTAVGDSKQRIMVWAGALKTVFEDFLSDFSAEKIQLSMNYRSAPRLVKLQQQMYASLQEEDIIIGTSEKWKKSDGEIKLYMASTEDDEAEYIVEDIQSKLKNGLNPEDICLICKQKPQDYTKRIISMLQDRGYKARIENEYQDLVKESVIILLVNFLLLSVDRKRPTEWEYIISMTNFILGDRIFEVQEKYYEFLNLLISKLEETHNNIKNCKEINTFKKTIDSVLDFWGIQNIMSTFPTYSQGDFLQNVLSKFYDLLWIEITLSDFNWTIAIENFLGKNTISIMTIHKSKGLEYSAVYFLGLEDGAFWNFRKESDQDRCAFFVALSRAKQNITFTFCERRRQLKYPIQKHDIINEFYTLLRAPGMAEVIQYES